MLETTNPTGTHATQTPQSADTAITRLYVCYHEPEVLAQAQLPPVATRVLLTDPGLLPARLNDPRIAESRFLLAMALNPNKYLPNSGYVGLFHASYDEKFSALPKLKDLPDVLPKFLSPERVVCPVTSVDYVAQGDRFHSGIGSALLRVLAATSIQGPSDRPGPMTNTFVAHHSVWRRFLPDWLRMYVAATDEIEAQNWDQSRCKDGIAPAYLCERFTTAWFVAQHDLKCMNLIGPRGAHYIAPHGFAERYHGDDVDSNVVTVNHANR